MDSQDNSLSEDQFGVDRNPFDLSDAAGNHKDRLLNAVPVLLPARPKLRECAHRLHCNLIISHALGFETRNRSLHSLMDVCIPFGDLLLRGVARDRKPPFHNVGIDSFGR